MPLATSYRQFKGEMTSLFLLDQRTQSQTPPMALVQLWVINEAIYLRAFRSLENFVEQAFLHYVMGGSTLGGIAVTSYLRPSSQQHAYELIRSSQNFLEWNKPDTIISRAETYLDSGGPIKAVYAAKQSLIVTLGRLRNHIAHNSRSSLEQYSKAIHPYLLTPPLTLPCPGDFLQSTSTIKGRSVRHLRNFLDEIADIGHAIAH